MKIFVTGATGVLGRRVLPLLVAAGHDVTAVARGPEKAELVRSSGATPVAVDLFDPAAVTAAVAGHEVVCNLATNIPPLRKAARAAAWATNDRIRTEASRNLVDAALAAGTTRFIQESICFTYRDGGDGRLDEDAPQGRAGPTSSAEAAEAATGRFTAAGRTGVVLRFASFYGADSEQTRGQVRMARQGLAPFAGAHGAYQSSLHLDDAASAVVAALGAPAGVYNVVEDDPATRDEQAAALGTALGTVPGWVAPPWLVKLGGPGLAFLGRSLRVSNRRFREATGWAPRYDVWSGWVQVVDAMGARPVVTPGRWIAIRACLAYLAAGAASVGIWAAVAPSSFFASYPGLGDHWVDVDGVFNDHLTRDVGDFMLALLVLTLVALCSRNRLVLRTTGAAWVVSALPHFLYHLAHRDLLGVGDQIASLGGLALQWLVGLGLIVFAPPTPAVGGLRRPRPPVAPGGAPTEPPRQLHEAIE
jgi:nucleoside-diphosphate-sugar epimerase